MGVFSVISSRVLAYLLGCTIHLYTVYITFDAHGWFMAVFAFFAAILAEGYWLYQFYQLGELWGPYTWACIIWIVICIVANFLAAIYD